MERATGPASETAQLAYGYAVVRRRPEATAILDRLLAQGGYLPPFLIAMAHVGLGDIVEAFRWLERGCDARDPWTTALKIHPAFEPLRGDPRYTELVHRMGLTPATRPQATEIESSP